MKELIYDIKLRRTLKELFSKTYKLQSTDCSLYKTETIGTFIVVFHNEKTIRVYNSNLLERCNIYYDEKVHECFKNYLGTISEYYEFQFTAPNIVIV